MHRTGQPRFFIFHFTALLGLAPQAASPAACNAPPQERLQLCQRKANQNKAQAHQGRIIAFICEGHAIDIHIGQIYQRDKARHAAQPAAQQRAQHRESA